MTKPPSIARFEQFYGASILLSLVATLASWGTQKEILAANPALAGATWLLPVTTAISLLVAALLWFFIARRASVVAKWVLVVFAAFSVFGLLTSIYAMATGTSPGMLPSLLGIVAYGLYIAAAAMLFRADAKAWFGEGLDDEDDDDVAVLP